MVRKLVDVAETRQKQKLSAAAAVDSGDDARGVVGGSGARDGENNGKREGWAFL